MSNILLSIPMWFLNGCLFLLYWLAGHIAEVLSLTFGLAIALSVILMILVYAVNLLLTMIQQRSKAR